MIGHGNPSVTKEAILDGTNDFRLASFYIPGFPEIPCLVTSPLRNDRHPSFSLYSPDGIRVFWKDFATGESGDMLSLVRALYGCSFTDTLIHIQRDMALGNPVKSGNTSEGMRKRPGLSGGCRIRTRMRDWKQYDFDYWSSYGVPENWIRHADVYPVSDIFIISANGFTSSVKADKYAYTYVERKDGKTTEKVYQPFNKNGMKFRSGHDSSVWDLWTKLPERGDKAIITSSRKDAMCLWAQTGIPSVSIQGEGMGVKPQVMGELKQRFSKVYVLFDNDFNGTDNWGRLNGKRLADTHDVIQIEIPDIYKCKDPSDLYHTYGGDIVRKVIRDITRYGNNK